MAVFRVGLPRVLVLLYLSRSSLAWALTLDARAGHKERARLEISGVPCPREWLVFYESLEEIKRPGSDRTPRTLQCPLGPAAQPVPYGRHRKQSSYWSIIFTHVAAKLAVRREDKHIWLLVLTHLNVKLNVAHAVRKLHLHFGKRNRSFVRAL